MHINALLFMLITCRNVLVGSRPEMVKLADFGLVSYNVLFSHSFDSMFRPVILS